MADQKEPINWNGNEGEFIPESEASSGTKAYRNSETFKLNHNCKAHYFGGKKIMQILSEPAAVGIRAYYGNNEKGEPQLYLVGVDAKGSDILANGKGESMVLDRSWPCPVWCDPDGLLNQ